MYVVIWKGVIFRDKKKTKGRLY